MKKNQFAGSAHKQLKAAFHKTEAWKKKINQITSESVTSVLIYEMCHNEYKKKLCHVSMSSVLCDGANSIRRTTNI